MNGCFHDAVSHVAKAAVKLLGKGGLGLLDTAVGVQPGEMGQLVAKGAHVLYRFA